MDGLSTGRGIKNAATRQAAAAPRDANGYATGNGFDDREVQSNNANQAVSNFQKKLPGGAWSSDPYTAAQQKRDFHQSAGFNSYFDPLNPGQQLTEQLGTSAYGFRQGLTGRENDASNDIKNQAGQALDQGIRQTRDAANSRGLLYSGLRQGAEQGVRGRVANAMASQINQSNADLNRAADARDTTATRAALGQADAAQAAQAEVDKANSENAVFRAQQMQQLSGAAMAGVAELGHGLLSPSKSPYTPNTTPDGNNYYSNQGGPRPTMAGY